jgi:transcriptional regulator with AAA-type ATPase domain
VTKVVIVGAGKGGRALLEMFVGDSTISIVGVADVNPWSPGLELARRLNIPVATDFRELIADPRLRELENVIERSVVLASTRKVEVGHLPLYMQQEGSPIRMTDAEGFLQAKERAIASFERDAVARFLTEARGNVSAAARKAGITRRNLHRLLSKYSIDSKSYR